MTAINTRALRFESCKIKAKKQLAFLQGVLDGVDLPSSSSTDLLTDREEAEWEEDSLLETFHSAHQSCCQLVHIQVHLLQELIDAILSIRDALNYWRTVNPVYHAASALPYQLGTGIWALTRSSLIPTHRNHHSWLSDQVRSIKSRVNRLKGAEVAACGLVGKLFSLDMRRSSITQPDSLSASLPNLSFSSSYHHLCLNRDVFEAVIAAVLKELSLLSLISLSPELATLILSERDDISPPRDNLSIIDVASVLIQEGKTNVGLDGRIIALNLKETAKPSSLTRYWIPCAFGAFSTWKLASTLVQLQVPIINALSDLRMTAYMFCKDWVYTPLVEMYRVIRHDESSMRMVNAASLQSDIDSLSRMVRDLALDQGRDALDVLALQNKVLAGDMRFVLEHYETEMTKPLRNAVFGDFIRTMLIQVQKGKVDVGVALSSLDKLMKSNELNFAFLAVMPTISVCAGLAWWCTSIFSRTPGWRLRLTRKVRKILRSIDRMLNSAQSSHDNTTQKGRLVVELSVLDGLLSPFPPHRTMELTRDLEDLYEVCSFPVIWADGGLTEDATHQQGLRVMDRIWRTSWATLSGA